MTPGALSYAAIWALDFEFIARDGEHPEVVCLVAHDLLSGRWVRVWQGDFAAPPFALGADTLFVGYSAAAEWSCFIALGWAMPARCIDLYAEFTRVTNGTFEGKMFPSLLAAAAHFGIATTDADHKGAMRDLILSGGPWNAEEQRAILDYCAADVRMTAELFRAMCPAVCRDPATFGGALLRGRYTCAVARMEWNGIPIDVATLARLRNGWDDIKLDLIADIDLQYGVFDGTSFVTARFAAYIERAGIPWPRLPSGALMLDDDTFRERAKSYPAIAPLRELRHALGKMRLNSLSVGQDGRNRAGVMPFGSKTGRNQPSNSRFVFGTSRWLRSLIQPAPGRAVAYVDWSSQEIAIAAALSGDDALWEAYTSGDPYMAFAKQAGLVPPEATKATHKAERQRAKAIVLGVGYGMSAESMAVQAGLHLDEARDLLLRHKLTYRQFWAWATHNQNAGLLGLTLQTTYGWTWQAGFGTTVNPRSLLNWPMQANGAEMMRLACCELTERGVMVCCPVHDALLVEGDADDIDNVIAATRAAMERASELVLGAGRIVRTDVDVVRHPERYADEAGVEMWDRVMARLAARGR
jgi:hypothetical protein